MIVSARTPSTPALCHSQDGMRRQVPGGGKTRMPRGAGPGGGVPYFASRIRQARWASSTTTFCSRIAGTSASMRRPERPIRSPGFSRAASLMTGWASADERLESRDVVIEAKGAGKGVEQPLRAGPPRLRPQGAAGRVSAGAGQHADRGRPVRGQRGPPDRARLVGLERRVAPAPALHGERAPHVDGERRDPLALRRRVSHRRASRACHRAPRSGSNPLPATVAHARRSAVGPGRVAARCRRRSVPRSPPGACPARAAAPWRARYPARRTPRRR